MKRCQCGKKAGMVPEAGGWLASGALLLLVPKCPACLAAYVAAFTGLGLSLPVAAGIRRALLAICLIALVMLSIRLFRKFQRSQTP